MQAARLPAKACTGVGTAFPGPSRTNSAVPECTANRIPPCQVRSTTIGGIVETVIGTLLLFRTYFTDRGGTIETFQRGTGCPGTLRLSRVKPRGLAPPFPSTSAPLRLCGSSNRPPLALPTHL